jgi:hypothetical protein
MQTSSTSHSSTTLSLCVSITQKCSHVQCSSECFMYLAEVLKNDLEKMACIPKPLYCKIDTSCRKSARPYPIHQIHHVLCEEIRKWGCFLASLMHHRLAELHVPKCFFYTGDTFPFECLKLMDNIGASCSGLRVFDARIMFSCFQPERARQHDSFFRALPQLRNLQEVRIRFFRSDDSALEQFGKHGTNIV